MVFAMARACFYCGATAVADDHAIPLWVPQVLGLGGARIEHMVAGKPGGDGEPADPVPLPVPSGAQLGDTDLVHPLHQSIDEIAKDRTELDFAEYSARVLCARCDEWAAKLDAEATPLVRPLVESGARSYSPEEQRLLAAWATRTAYSILAVERKSTGVPKQHRRALRERNEPHSNVYVGYGRYRAPHIGALAARLVVNLGEADGRNTEAYSVLAVFGHMALKVFGVHRRTDQAMIRSPQGQLIQVWPPGDDAFSWPPLWSLTEEALDAVFNHQPFYRPYRFRGTEYRGPGAKIPYRKRRTEGPGPRR